MKILKIPIDVLIREEEKKKELEDNFIQLELPMPLPRKPEKPSGKKEEKENVIIIQM